MTATNAKPRPAEARPEGRTDSEQLAEILLSVGAVDRHMLERAKAVQQTQGRWLGSVLVELGMMGPEEIAQVLSNHLSLKTVDLDKVQYNAAAVQLLPESMARRFGVVPVSLLDNTLHLAMVNPLDTLACDLIQARTGMRIEPLVATERDVRSTIDRFYTHLNRTQKGPAGPAAKDAKAGHKPAHGDEILHVDDLLRITIENRASDLHLSVGIAPTIRVDGDLSQVGTEKLTATRMNELIYAILTDEQISHFEENWELDFAYSVRGLSRFRVNVHRQRGTLGAVFRAVPVDPPSLDGLGMPDVLKKLAGRPRGLVLVTGPTGSGKSTTLAAMIREINVTRRRHVVTIEDPIEFLHRNEKSIIIQREVGMDTKSFSAALRHVLRQDPDVILIGEMRDLETISAAITAAETGHLVLATLHTTSAAQTVDRIVDVFPPHQQEQIRVQLSTVAEGIVCQTLLPLADGKGRTCAQEILVANSAIRNLIREGKTHQMPSVLQSGASEGMQTLDQALKVLVQQGKVVPQIAMAVASNPQDFKMFLNMR
ncbi:MAG: PilT/PilU family type 4a pilus ATPase [Armatimonadota bacterium]